MKSFAEWSIQIKLLETGITGVVDEISIPNSQLVTPAPSILNTTLTSVQPDVKMFILSSETQNSGSKFGDDSVWVDNGAQSLAEVNSERFNGYLGIGMSNQNGVFTTPIEVVLTGSDLIGAAFFFSDSEWATEAIINGQTVTNNGPKWLITDASQKVSELRITFTKWSHANRPFRLLGIMADFLQEYGEERIQDLTIDDAAADNDLYIGVKSGRIRLNLLDFNGEFKSYVNAELLKNGITLVTKFGGKNFTFHRIGTWKYNDEEHTIVVEGEQRIISELSRTVDAHTVTGTLWDLYNDIKSYDPNADIHFVPDYLSTEWQSQEIDATNVGGKLIDIYNKFLRSCMCAMIDDVIDNERAIRFEKEPSVVAYNGQYAKITDADAKDIQSNILSDNAYEAVSWSRENGSAQLVGNGTPVYLDIGMITPKDNVTAQEIVTAWSKGKSAVSIEQINPDTVDADGVVMCSWDDGDMVPLLQRLRVWDKGKPILTRSGNEIKFVVLNRSIKYDGSMRLLLTARQE